MRKIGCLGAIVVSVMAAVAVAAAIPTIPSAQSPEGVTWFVRIFSGVLVCWVVGMTLNAILVRLFPTPAELAKRAADLAMKEAPLRPTANAVAGSYLRVRGKLELDEGSVLEAPVTGRACVAYVAQRLTHSTRSSSGTSSNKTKQRGVRARLVDGAGSIAIALDGVDWTPTGDPTADAIMARGQAVMKSLGDDPKLMPEIRFAGARATVWSDGTNVGCWPEGASPPSVERLSSIDDRDFVRTARLGGRTYWEEALVPGQEVEAVGLVVSVDGRLVLTGPTNGQLQVVAR